MQNKEDRKGGPEFVFIKTADLARAAAILCKDNKVTHDLPCQASARILLQTEAPSKRRTHSAG